MLKGLRNKFIALNMVIVTLALAVSFATICYLDWRQDLEAVYSQMDEELAKWARPVHSPFGVFGMEDPFGTFGPIEENGAGADAATDGVRDRYMRDIAEIGGAEAGDDTASDADTDADGASDSDIGLDALADAGVDAGMGQGIDAEAGRSHAADAAAGAGEDSADADGNDVGNAGPDAAAGSDGGSDSAEGEGGAGADTLAPQIGGRRAKPVIAMALYAVSDDGLAVFASRDSTAYVDEAVLPEVLEEALDRAAEGEEHGRIQSQGLIYSTLATQDAVLVAFADGSEADSWISLARVLVVVGIGAWLVFLAVSVFFARWSLRPVQRSLEQQRQFVADASHELKTPLTVILANTAILKSHGLESVASQSQWVDSTQLEAERMQDLVADMLELARADSNAAAPSGTQPVRESVDFSDLAEGEVLQFESVAFERGVVMEADLQPGITVEGDRARLQRLVSTLVDNACKYADEGTAIEVGLHAAPRAATSSEATFTVRNFGAPIAPEDLSHVFDRFYRADKARQRSGGHGLGLAIAREIAQAHGGTIAVTSDASAGTLFTVMLPCTVTASSAKRSLPDSAEADGARPPLGHEGPIAFASLSPDSTPPAVNPSPSDPL